MCTGVCVCVYVIDWWISVECVILLTQFHPQIHASRHAEFTLTHPPRALTRNPPCACTCRNPGDFIVRESVRKPGQYVLVVRVDGQAKVSNFVIETDGAGWC